MTEDQPGRSAPAALLVEVMPGLGDAIYHRPYLRACAERAFITTRWPELFSDLPLLASPAPGARHVRPRYTTGQLAFCSVPEAIGRAFGFEPDVYQFDLPSFPRPGFPRPYALIRIPTLRRRFYAPARNPDARYIQRAAELLSGLGLYTVGVAKVGADEWFDDHPPAVDHACWTGELGVTQLLGAVAGAEIIVAGPGWTVPAAVATGTAHVTIYGGAAQWNALPKLIDPRMGEVAVTAVEPDEFCRNCRTVQHDCPKHISDFDRKFMHAVDYAMYLRERRVHSRTRERSNDATVHELRRAAPEHQTDFRRAV